MKKYFIGLLLLIILIFATWHFLTKDKKPLQIQSPPPQSATHEGTTLQQPSTTQPANVPVVVDEAGPEIIVICTPGAIRPCRCADGQQGKQMCSADGSFWLDCGCESTAGPIEDGPGAGMACAPGEMQTCYCNDGTPGTQECMPDGEWTDCECQNSEVEDPEDEGPIENPQPDLFIN